MMYQYLSQMPPKALGTRSLDSASLMQSLEQPPMPLGVADTRQSHGNSSFETGNL
jgi:hypothetical protein